MRLPLARLPAWLLSLWLLCGVGFAAADEPQAVARLVARVNDSTATLTAQQRGLLEAKLTAFEGEKGAQIAVLIVPTVKPETVEQYALRVVEATKLGRRGTDDGALLLVAKEDRKLRIEVGYGLEGALNDATAKRIISETIGPRFKQGDYYGGIDAGVDAMIKVIGGEPLPAPRSDPPRARAAVEDNSGDLLLGGFIVVFVVGGLLRAIFGRLLAAGMVGVAAGFIASLLISSMLVAVLIGIAGFVASLFVDLLGSSGGSPAGAWSGVGGKGRGFAGGRGRSTDSWGGGGDFGGHGRSRDSWGGGGDVGGGSSSGDFSGGGGDFGGGGASGDW